MSQIRRTAAVVAALLAVAVHPATARAQARDSGGVDLRIPDSIGVFRLVARRPIETETGGVMLRYRRADGLTGDVFVYPGPDLARRCDLECARGVLKEEGEAFMTVIPELISRHYVDSMAVTADSALTTRAEAPWRLGRHLSLRVSANGAPRWSDLYLYYLPGYRVKLRSTYAPDAAASAAISELAAAAPAAMSAGSTRREPTPTNPPAP